MSTETSARRFTIGLYEEHLEEASFLAEQRDALTNDPELGWRDLDDFELRLEAHIDALVVGGDLALEVCRRRARDGDAWERHAALRVFCRHNRINDALAALTHIEADDAEASTAAARALCQEAPPPWHNALAALLNGDHPPLEAMAASIAGAGRLDAAPNLLALLPGAGPATRARLAWALGRCGDAAAIPALLETLNADDDLSRDEAAVALLRLGDDSPVKNGLLMAQHSVWPRRALGIGGNRSAVNVLLDVLQSKSAGEQCVLSLGLLGDVAAVAPLVKRLDDDALGDMAAVALNLITGANLYAEVFVADDIDVDELFDEEREAFAKDGTLPGRADGEAYGSWERRPLRAPAQWRQWLQQNKSRFSREHRWRMGQRYGPAALVNSLLADSLPLRARAAVYDELVCRYAMPVAFEADERVAQQDRCIAEMRAWAQQADAHFEPGAWYFAGQKQD